MVHPSARKLLLALILAGCTSSPESSTLSTYSQTPNRVERRGDSYYIHLSPETRAVSTTLPGVPRQMFPRVAEVYEELEIPIETIHTTRFLLGNERLRVSRSIGGISLSKVVDCGSTLTGSRADTYRLTMSILTQLYPAGPDSTRVETIIKATGQTSEGASTNAVSCMSTGNLERTIIERLLDRVVI